MRKIRGVFEDHAVSAAIDNAAQKNPRVAEVFRGLGWGLAREAEVAGYELPGHSPPQYLYKTSSPIVGDPVITARYEYDDTDVTIKSVLITIQGEDE